MALQRSGRDIDKNAVTALLDKIEQKKIKYKGRHLGGALTASATLAQISALFNWLAARQHFTSPIVKGMKKARSKPKPRHLVLTDAELLLWPLLDDTYGAVLKCALLTAQRFHKVSSMRHSDLKAHLIVPGHYDADQQWIDDFQIDNVWDAARDDDPKNKQVSAVPLSAAVRKVIKAVPVIDAADAVDFVFSLNGRGQIKGWVKYKQRLDARFAAALRQQDMEFRVGNTAICGAPPRR